MFELTQTADLIGWNGDRNEARWGDFVADIKRSLDKHNTDEAAPASSPTAGVSATTNDDATIETVFWTSIKDGDDPADFEAYLKRYENGHYSDPSAQSAGGVGRGVCELCRVADRIRQAGGTKSARANSETACRAISPARQKEILQSAPVAARRSFGAWHWRLVRHAGLERK